MTAETHRHITLTSHKQRSLKEEYSEAVAQLQDIFPAWSAEDLELALSDVNGDLEIVIHRISEGHIQPWSEQGKKPAQAAIEKSVAPRRNGRQQRVLKDTPRVTANRTRSISSAQRVQDQPFTSTAKVVSLNKTHNMGSGDFESQVQEESHGKSSEITTTSSLTSAPRENIGMHPQRIVPETIDGSLREELHAASTFKGREVSLTEQPVRYRSKHSQKVEPREHKEVRSAPTNIHHEPSEESLHLYVQGIVGETEQHHLSSSEDATVTSLSTFAGMSLSDSTPASVSRENPPSLPIVQMPSSLSSRINTAHLVQPVVVLPLRATMRPGLSVNFGGSLQHPRQQQPVGIQTEQNTSVASVGGYSQPAYYAAVVSDDSHPRRLYDVGPTETLKANPALMGTVPAAPSASYRTMGIETSIEGYVGDFAPGSATASQQTRKNQPIQRPSMPRDSFTVSSPPPGLRPTSASASSATSSETIMMADEMRIKGHHQQTFSPEDSSSGESAPGLGPYYHQMHQHQQHHHHQYQQPTHHDRSYPHGRSHPGTNVHYQQPQHPSQQPTRPNPSSPAYHQGYGNTYTGRPFDNIVPTGGNNANVTNKPPFDSSERLSSGANPNIPAAPWSPYANSAASPNQPQGQYYGNAGVYSQGFYSDDHQLNYGPAMPLQQHSSTTRQTHQYHHQSHHQYGRPVQQQQSAQHMMDQSEAAVGGMQYSSFYGHANAGNHGIHSTYSGAPGIASGNRRNPGYLHPQPSTKNL